MAKKRKKDKEEKEEYEFKPPTFDEKEFLEKELRDTKTVLFTIGYGALFGLIAGLIANLDQDLAMIGLIIVIGGLISLKYFYSVIKVDTTQFQKKNWAGNAVWFFFTFLAIWVLLFNYPFADHADPSVRDVVVWVYDGDSYTAIDYKYVDTAGSYAWVPRDDVALNTIVHASSNYTVNITARIADNGDLETARIVIGGGTYIPMTYEGEHRYGYQINGADLSSGGLSFTIEATDGVENITVFTPVSTIPVT